MRDSIYDEYAELISNFLEKVITIKVFESLYLRKFKDELSDIEDSLYHVLQTLFEDIDAYTTDISLIEDYPGDYITEEQLRESAVHALSEVKRLKLEYFASKYS